MTDFTFESVEEQHFTQVPNCVVDRALPYLTGAETKVFLYIVRRTYGFGKDEDAISFDQMSRGIQTREGTVLDSGTGLGRSAVIRAVQGLAKKRVITVKRRSLANGADGPNVYRVNVRRSFGRAGRFEVGEGPDLGPGEYRF